MFKIAANSSGCCHTLRHQKLNRLAIDIKQLITHACIIYILLRQLSSLFSPREIAAECKAGERKNYENKSRTRRRAKETTETCRFKLQNQKKLSL